MVVVVGNISGTKRLGGTENVGRDIKSRISLSLRPIRVYIPFHRGTGRISRAKKIFPYRVA